MPEDSLAGEAGALQRALLGDVLHVGLGLDPLGERGSEQVLGEGPLGRRAVAVPAVAGQQ